MANKYVKSFNFGGDTLYPLPIVTAEQNGQVLKVVDGKWGTGKMFHKMIEFIVKGDTYYAEEGMTWAEWIESDLNTDGDTFYILDGVYVRHDINYIDYNDWSYVKPTDLIIANYRYYSSSGGGSND